MQESRKLLHIERIPIRWGDMDALGHVNNTVYFRYMEQARIGCLEALGVDLGSTTQGPVIINARCTFLKEMIYPGTVEVKVYCGALGRSSIPTYYELRRDTEDDLYAEGDSKIVWVDRASGKSCPVPDWLRERL